MYFQGTYYSGQTSIAYKAQVEARGSQLYIHCTAPDGAGFDVQWDAENILPGDLYRNSNITLRYGSYPHQILELQGDGIIQWLELYHPNSRKWSPSRMVRKFGKSGIAIMLTSLVALMVLVYLVVIPFCADTYARYMISPETENELGEYIYDHMMSMETIDSAKTRLATQYALELIPDRTYPLQITVVKDAQVNAFALPGGHIVIYSGLFDKMEDHEELAALLGHEYGHVKLKHSTRSLFRNLANYFFLSIVLNDVNGISAVILENANTMRTLHYSRGLERDADNFGLELLAERKVDPKGMVELFDILEREHPGGDNIPDFLSTHPLTKERKKHAEDFIREHPVNIDDNKLETIWLSIKKPVN